MIAYPPLTREEKPIREARYDAVKAANDPSTLVVDVHTIEIYEDYLTRVHGDTNRLWTESESPEDDKPEWTRYAGPNCGPMFKGVELLSLKK